MSIEEQIKNSRTIKSNSLKTYMSALRALYLLIKKKKVEKIKDLDFLKKFSKVEKIIDAMPKITSKKNKLTAIIVALSSEKNKDTELIDKYQKKLKNLGDKYNEFLRTQQKTETQKKNWIEFEDLVDIVNSLLVKVKAQKIRNKSELTKNQYKLLQEYVILSTYLAFPMRNDFANMPVISYKNWKSMDGEEKTKYNYLVLKSKITKFFVLNNFKNSKYLGVRILKIEPPLNKILNLWLSHNTSGYFLTQINRVKPMTVYNITKTLNGIFHRYTGKNISTSMLRHIQVSHFLRDEPTIKELEVKAKEVENKFLHSFKTSNLVYRKLPDKENEEVKKK